MRLLHPSTIEILAKRSDINKTHLSNCWSEVFKWKASKQKHPKQFINDDYALGQYLKFVYLNSIVRGCNFNIDKIKKLGVYVSIGWDSYESEEHVFYNYFDEFYLFSDAVSLYQNGINIFIDIFGDRFRKYVPVESHKEIARKCLKVATNRQISSKDMSNIIKNIKNNL